MADEPINSEAFKEVVKAIKKLLKSREQFKNYKLVDIKLVLKPVGQDIEILGGLCWTYDPATDTVITVPCPEPPRV